MLDNDRISVVMIKPFIGKSNKAMTKEPVAAPKRSAAYAKATFCWMDQLRSLTAKPYPIPTINAAPRVNRKNTGSSIHEGAVIASNVKTMNGVRKLQSANST